VLAVGLVLEQVAVLEVVALVELQSLVVEVPAAVC